MWRGARGAARGDFRGHAAGKFTRSRRGDISRRGHEARWSLKKNDSHHPHLVHSNCALYFYITAVTSTSAYHHPPVMRRRVSFPGALCAFTATVMQRRGGIVTLPVLTMCITAGETMTEHRRHPGSFRVSHSPGPPVDAKLN